MTLTNNHEITVVIGGNTEDLPLVEGVQFQSIPLPFNNQSDHMYSRCLSAKGFDPSICFTNRIIVLKFLPSYSFVLYPFLLLCYRLFNPGLSVIVIFFIKCTYFQ